MKVQIARNAYDLYRGRPNYGSDPVWEKFLSDCALQWVPVETKYLFCHQYNTGPVQGFPTGVKLMGRYVVGIDYEGDARIEAIQTALNLGKQAGGVSCHSYRDDNAEFVGLWDNETNIRTAKELLAKFPKR